MKKIFLILIASFLTFSFNASAEFQEYTIVIKDHKFIPQNLEIPVGKKVKLIVDNQDKTVEEFESYELNREKIIKGNAKIVIFIGPLKAGTYKYFGEFNSKTAQGTIIAK